MPIETPTQTPGVSPAPVAPLSSVTPVAPATTSAAPASEKSSLPITILIVALVALVFGAIGYFGGRYLADMLGIGGSTNPPQRPVAPVEQPVDETPEEVTTEDPMPAEDEPLIMEDDGSAAPLDLGSTDPGLLPEEGAEEPLDLTPTE